MENISKTKTKVNDSGNIFRINLRNFILLFLIILLISIFAIINPVFIELESIFNLFRETAVLFVVSIGMTLIILTGGLDLSIGSNLAFSCAIGAVIFKTTSNPYLAMFISIIAATFIGFINGFMIGKLKINSVLFTLAMLGITRSLAVLILNDGTIRVINPVYNFLGGFSITLNDSNLSVSMFLIFFLFILFFLILNHSLYGKRLKAIGGNILASKAVGVNVELNVIITYALMGLFVGIGGIISIGRALSAVPLAGIGLEFDTITAVILGGASVSGGNVDIKGTFLGVLLFGVIIKGLGLLNISVYYIELAKGIIFLIAVLLNLLTEKYQRSY